MKIQTVQLWDYYHRVLHWLLALSVLFLAVSAWLMQQLVSDSNFWFEWHLMVGQFTSILLLVRLGLLFRPGSFSFDRFKLTSNDRQKVIDTLKCYLTMAKFPLPSWLAINPLWRILYLVFYALLLLMAVSGLLSGDHLVLGVYWPEVHSAIAFYINIWLVAHLVAVFLHDWKGTVGRISAMVNGIAYFQIEEQEKPPIEPSVSITDLLNSKKK